MTTDNAPQNPQTQKKKKSLREKYEIPISHLDFPYIKKCCNILEIERIVKILRSGEEGHYPELLECAEKRLIALCPDHKTLVTCEPIMTKSCLNPEEWDSVHKEILEWKQEIDDTDAALSQYKDKSDPSDFYPDIRRPIINLDNDVKKPPEKEKRTAATNYNQWDKFDADKECLKMDLEEEKRAEEKHRKELAEKKKQEEVGSLSLEEKEVLAIKETAESLSLDERKVMSLKEKELGNEFFKRNLFNEALQHYTRSIYLHPTAVSYNNRAATYLKQCKFSKAEKDLNICLEMDPDNVKAHYRRALALQHRNEFQKALDDVLFVLKCEPNHVIAKHIANELRENCCKLPKTHRLKTNDENDPEKIVYTEVPEKEFLHNYKTKKDFVEVNHLNLPKVMCNCNGRHTNDPLICSHDPIRYQHIHARYGEKANEKIEEMERASRMLGAAGSNRHISPSKNFVSEPVIKSKPLIQPTEVCENQFSATGGRRLDIVELEKIEEEDLSLKIQGIHLDRGVDNSALNKPKVVTSCVITDRRKDKTPNMQLYNYQDDDSEEGKQEEAGSLLRYESYNDHFPKTKEEKMNLNMNLKESLDVGGAGDATVSDDVALLEDGSPTECPSFPDPMDDNHPECFSFPEVPLPVISLSGSSSINLDRMVDYESSSSEPMTDDDLPNEITVDVHQVELKSLYDIDLIANQLFPGEALVKCDCGQGYVIWTTQFEIKWLSLEKSPCVLEERSKLIRLICPHRLSTVISNMLNEDLLSGFINCLHHHFDPVSEGEKIRSYLMSIVNLQRFKIINCFLPSTSKFTVNMLLKKLNPIVPELEDAFS